MKVCPDRSGDVELPLAMNTVIVRCLVTWAMVHDGNCIIS